MRAIGSPPSSTRPSSENSKTVIVPLIIVHPRWDQSLEFYVSSAGSDTHSGDSWKSSFATVQRAIAATGNRPATIHIRGTVATSTPIVVADRSSLHIVGEQGAAISKSLKVGHWKKDWVNGHAAWSADCPKGITPFELFVGPKQERASLPRFPEKGFLEFETIPTRSPNTPWNVGQDRATYRAGDFPNLAHPQEAVVVVNQLWVTSRLPVSNVDRATNQVQFAKKSVFSLKGAKDSQPSKYYLENVAEALSLPGQWYYNPRLSRIFYLPRPKDVLKSFVAEVPTIGPVMQVDRSHHLVVEGVRFSGSEYRYPALSSGDGQAATSVPGAVQIQDSSDCRFTQCRVDASGTYGFEVEGQSGSNFFDRCAVTDVGAGGIKIGHGTSGTKVEDCVFEHLGLVFPSAIGVWIGASGHNLVSHSRIQDSGYTGISVGWTWGYGKSTATDNLIEDNDIQDLGRGELSDMGGIYTLGVSPGTVLRHNRISHVDCADYGGWGIYLDEGSSDILVENNLVTDCKTGNFHQHYGANNLVRNNIFAFAPTVAQVIRTRREDHISFTMQNNVFEWANTPLFGGDPSGGGIVFRNNLIWRTDTKIFSLPSFALGNVIGDPKFENPLKGNYKMSANSPAFILGIRPFDLTDFGPRKEP
jgi:hypothetical protein